ncbi:MAG: transcriptional repressor [Sphaerochaeta sp.]|nr:transcriptional repressor [Sphaerochaeta sp.]
MTKARKAILNALEEAREPISVTELAKELTDFCDPATVYRNLHYLEKNNLATSFILHCSEHGTERYYSAKEGKGHHHWFHCENCHRFIDLGGCFYTEQLRQFEHQHGFTVNDHTFYLTGICQTCKEESGI